MTETYEDVLPRLQAAYDAMVRVRQRQPVEGWKQAERQLFLDRLRAEPIQTLLEVGAGTGVHGKWFADAGLDVVCTDPSAAMVEACQAIGLTAEQADVLGFDRNWQFDAVFAMNCLLHVPRAALPAAFAAIRDVLRPEGVCYLGQYGGIDRAGTFADDVYEPKRFFSYLADDALVATAADAGFGIIDFHSVAVDVEPGTHFQSLTLRRIR